MLVGEVLVGPELGAGEHDAEEEEHDDGADVDEHLGGGDELGRQEDVLRGHGGEHRDEVERGVHDVVARDHADAAVHDHRGDRVEEDVLSDHQRGTLRTLASEPAS